MQLDDWQKKVLETEGNLCVRAGRQVGKSTIISIKAAEFAVKNPKKCVMVIASVERQSYLLFEKILNYLYLHHKKEIKTGVERPTKHIIKLKNGSIIHSVPTGLTGEGIRGYTINLLIADECAFIPDEVFTAVIPSLAVAKGTIWALSTPHGKEGYFYRCFTDESFKNFHVSSEDCPRKDEKFLEREKLRMTRLQYTQEYLGEFIDELKQFFPSDLIKKCMVLRNSKTENKENLLVSLSPEGSYFLGVDIARLGTDESVMLTLLKREQKNLKMIDMKITKKNLLTETLDNILILDKDYHYKKIYIDDGGVGSGVFDFLLREDQTKRKVVAINNAARPLDKEEKRRKKILKEDLYNNLLRLMEQGKIDLWDDENLFLSLKSIQYEYSDDGQLKIFGSYSHITEALTRAAWCMMDKSLNIWCA